MLNENSTPKDLAHLLRTDYSKLCYAIYAKQISDYYTTFEIAKKNGGSRIIRTPNPQLKTIQRRMLGLLSNLYVPHRAATAFVEGRGIVFNARQHTRKACVFNIDLRDFYDQIHFGRVKGLLTAKPYSLSDDVARIISHICCVDGVLPQGAPTSPIISNMICKKLDRELSLIAKKENSFYTRYADDITFSFTSISDNCIYYKIDGNYRVGDEIKETVQKNGFDLNDEKVRIQFFNERQIVTGLKVNRKVNVDRRYVRTTRAMLHALELNPQIAQIKYLAKNPQSTKKLHHVVAGRVNFIGMVKGIDSTVYQTIARKYNALNFREKLRTEPKSGAERFARKLSFYENEDRKLLERSVWVIEFDSVPGLDVDQQLVQGSAFMVKGQKLVTADHLFTMAGDPRQCVVFRIFEPHKRRKAILLSRNSELDIALLRIEDEEEQQIYDYLKISTARDPKPGFKVSVVGFPQLQPGHRSVTVLPCNIVNTYTKSALHMGEVDVEIAGGNSGGPVINAFQQVIGIALSGRSVSIAESKAAIEGNNSFIFASAFIEFFDGD